MSAKKELPESVTQQPVFFAFPYAQALWYTQGPDLRVLYQNQFTGSTCSPNNEQQINQSYTTNYCEFCDVGPTNFGIPSGDITDYIVTTDYTTKRKAAGKWSSPVNP